MTTTAGGWQLEEGSAVAYERYLVPVYMDPWARSLVDAVAPSGSERVLDVACGTGIAARHAAARLGPGGEVTGVDLNPSMLAVAREVGAGTEPAIRWEHASVDDLPFPDASFDVALCQQGLQFFLDEVAALAEIRRVLRAGGRLGLSTVRSLEHQPGYEILIESIRRHVGVEAADVVGSPYTLGAVGEVRALLEKAGFGEIHARIEIWPARFGSAGDLLRAETSSSPLGDLVASLDRDVQETLVGELTAKLHVHADDDGIVFPFETTVVTAVR
jgi:SAM-dependent methyltransferase